MDIDKEFELDDLYQKLDFLEDYLNDSFEVLLYEYEIYKYI